MNPSLLIFFLLVSDVLYCQLEDGKYISNDVVISGQYTEFIITVLRKSTLSVGQRSHFCFIHNRENANLTEYKGFRCC